MEKKDIYEHLAKIYLDASLKRKKSNKVHARFKQLFFVSIAVIFALSAFLLTPLFTRRPLESEILLVLCPDPVKLNFNFDPAKKELFTLNLKGLNLARFKSLGFSTMKTNRQDSVSLRVEFNSTFKEKSEIYIKDIPNKWQDYKINLAEFKNISDWSAMSDLSFIVEEWNTSGKKGIVYIDNVRLFDKKEKKEEK